MKVLDGIIDIECDLAMEHISRKDFIPWHCARTSIFVSLCFSFLRWLYKSIDDNCVSLA